MLKPKPSAREQVAWMESHATNLIEPNELEARIAKGLIEVKFGVDPTTPNLHLGHMVPVWILKRLQQWGHRITLVIGDFTAYIGDPSGRQGERPALTKAQIEKNLASYKLQVGKVLDLKKVSFQRNAQWLGKLTPYELIDHVKNVSLTAATQREDFKNRGRVTLAEVLYSTLVGIDSVQLKSDLEIGGQDQLLNLTASRELMRAEGLKPESILTTPILRGTTNDGRKMSKSFGNAINVEDSPSEMFGKVMSVPDEYLTDYFKLATELPETEWKNLVSEKPREAKLLLAKTIVGTYYTTNDGLAAEKSWKHTFSEHHIPNDLPTHKIKPGTKDFIALLVDAGITKSRTEAMRLLNAGAIEQLEGGGAPKVLNLKSAALTRPAIYKIGKRRFLKVG